MPKNLILSVLGCGIISGCASFSDQETTKEKIVLPNADVLILRKIEWEVTPSENGAKFSLDSKGYENLGLNLSDIIRYIEQQNTIIGICRNE